ncbi:bacitracin export permease protein BceB [Mammaliicoccus stepanovicii]|uniref:ABC transporter permease n=2 Tax=Mammaliicoccus stepanovicii TaxID=643214 RepID=A0A239YHY6_9STAP|nr:ABC transporter permease [Mammaliicoccus stepanovicii]GGI40767.1 bacitracin export permease protein BceB [Mammaliicoccus stepanovicii]SNV58023.1 ABC transporter permease [Mammaliicoccus stepanovicii]
MNFNQIVVKNLKRNIRHYGMYIFSITMSVILFFGFVTLKYSDDLNGIQSGVKPEAGIKVGVTLLTCIIIIFLLYANQLFIKRRSREMGLYQLIGMTKREVFKIFQLENLVLFVITLFAGTALGIFSSKILFMILFKILDHKQTANLEVSPEAFLQTILLMIGVYIIISIQNYIFIKRKTILSLMNEYQASDTKVKKIKAYELVFGVIGIIMIVLGYYISSMIFENLITNTMTELYLRMLTVLFLTIVGAYLLFRCSISLIFNTIRKYKKGMLSVTDVVSTSSIMHKMKTNALSLTIIATVSALAVGLLSLSYISYYNAQETAHSQVPNDYIFTNKEKVENFKKSLNKEDIAYSTQNFHIVRYAIDDSKVFSQNENMTGDSTKLPVAVVKASDFDDINLTNNEVAVVGYNDFLDKLTTVNHNEEMTYKINHKTKKLRVKSISKEDYLAPMISLNSPVYVVSDDTYNQMKHQQPKNELLNHQFGINLKHKSDVQKAEKVFNEQVDEIDTGRSYQQVYEQSKSNLGLMLFVLGFLGVAFLLSTGCIIYIKQIDETEDETSNYKILRKLGYTSRDMSRGIGLKIGFNFALPLVIGLCHGYFAARSAGFLLGQSFYTPVLIVMALYSLIYIIFGILAYIHSKRVIQQAL